MYDSSFTDRQIEARRKHIEAIRAHRIARHGERAKTRKRLEAAALEVVEADVEAERAKKVEAA